MKYAKEMPVVQDKILGVVMGAAFGDFSEDPDYNLSLDGYLDVIDTDNHWLKVQCSGLNSVIKPWVMEHAQPLRGRGHWAIVAFKRPLPGQFSYSVDDIEPLCWFEMYADPNDEQKARYEFHKLK